MNDEEVIAIVGVIGFFLLMGLVIFLWNVPLPKIPHKLGEAYYQLMKPEKIQAQKEIAIFYKGNVYIGKEARQLLGLPDYEVKVNPNLTPEYQVFVQSTSVNRKLIAGTQLLILS